MEPSTTPAPSTPAPAASLCVLASGSAGNCSVLLVHSSKREPGIILLDAGLSPRRTRRMLEAMGFTFDHLRAIILTHLDHDHWHGGWPKALPQHATIHAHKRHAARGRRTGALPANCDDFDEGFTLDGGARVHAVLASHDELGVASYRLEVPDSNGRVAVLGFATDLGRVRYDMVEHMRGVDVLAIESNYCPELQAASSRPWFLKRRITGGSGHLSNHEALDAIRQIRPRSHVVFLHLSRECNCPGLVAGLHQNAPYAFTITSQTEPTPWVPIRASERAAVAPEPPIEMVQMPLFGPREEAHAAPRMR